jgi:hypothetical protein
MLKAFRFSKSLADLFFLLLPHKFSSIAYVKLVNFNAEKRKKKEQKIRKPKCFEYISYENGNKENAGRYKSYKIRSTCRNGWELKYEHKKNRLRAKTLHRRFPTNQIFNR